MIAARPAATIVTRASRPDAIPLATLPDEPFSLVGSLVHAVVRDERDGEALLLTLARGADVLVELDLPVRQRAALLDDIARIADIRKGLTPALSADERAVVAGLAEGKTLTEVARALGMSRRTATRRLAAAKIALGAATTMELLIAAAHSLS